MGVLSLGWEDLLEKEMTTHYSILGFPGKESACHVGDLGSILGLGRSPGEGNGYLLQYSALRIPWDTFQELGMTERPAIHFNRES